MEIMQHLTKRRCIGKDSDFRRSGDQCIKESCFKDNKENKDQSEEKQAYASYGMICYQVRKY